MTPHEQSARDNPSERILARDYKPRERDTFFNYYFSYNLFVERS